MSNPHFCAITKFKVNRTSSSFLKTKKSVLLFEKIRLHVFTLVLFFGFNPYNYAQVTNVNTGNNYATIQAAIDDPLTLDGHVITIAAGTYPELVTVNKQLTFNGPQANTNANTRFALFTNGVNGPKADPTTEAIITPPTSNPLGGNPGANDLFRILVDQVTINGIVIDGNNPAIIGSSILQTGTIDIDARRGVTNRDNSDISNPINNFIIEYCIIQNIAQRGINLSNDGPVSSGNLISENIIRNFGSDPGNGGQAVILFTNAYADITNNTIEVSTNNIGIHLQNFFSNGSMTWSGNNLTVGQDAIGMHTNLFYAPNAIVTISNNTVNAAPGVTGASDFTWGINLWSVQLGSTVLLSNNIVGDSGGEFGRGINLWNLPTSNVVTIYGGSVGNSIIGINADNVDPYYGGGGNCEIYLNNVLINAINIGIRARVDTLLIPPLFAPNTVGGFVALFLDQVSVIGGLSGIEVISPFSSSPYSASITIENNSELNNTGQNGTGISVMGSEASASISGNLSSINGYAIGIDVNGGFANVDNNHIYDNGIGVRFINSGYGSVTGNIFNDVIDNGTDVLLMADAGNVTATPGNWFAGDQFGVNNLSPNIVDATINYWDDPAGPTTPNGGSGAAVSDLVIYCPWLEAAPPAASIGAMPTASFTYNVNGGPAIPISSNNDGNQDPSEVATINICNGTFYTWNTVTTNASHAYIAQTASNGNINGLVASPPPAEIEQFDNTVGVLNSTIFNGTNYSLTLVDPAMVGTATQKIIFYSDVDFDNNFDPLIDCFGDSITINYIINPKPRLQAEVNNVLVINNFDGITDTGRITVCDGITNNVFISDAFQELTGASEPNVFQSFITNGTNFVPWCNNCATSIGNFTPPNFATASLVNPLVGGTVTVTFLVWQDESDDQIIDPDECTGDTLRYVITVLPKPTIQANINGVQITNNNDGIPDTARFSVCNATPNNVFISSPFLELTGSTNVRIYQTISNSGTSFAPWCNACSAPVASFIPVNPATAGLVNPAVGGIVTITLLPWSDTNNNTTIDPGECLGDTIRYLITVNPVPSLQTTINSIQLTNNHNGVDESGTFNVCGTTPNNITFTQFIDQTNVSLSGQVKVIQQFTRTNVNFAPVDGTFPIAAYAGTPFSRSVSLVDPLIPGTLVMSFRIFFDADNDNLLDIDECANDLVVYTVTVYGPPVIRCPNNLTISCSSEVPAANINSVQILGNPCPGGALNVVLQSEVESGRTCAHKFTLTRTYRVTNNCCPFVECVQVITVNDTTRPVVNCPANQTVTCASDVPLSNVGLITSSDNCSGTVTNSFLNDAMIGQTCLNKFTVRRTYAAIDACGNQGTCVQLITVNDDINPRLTCPPNLNLICPNDVPPINPATVNSIDNCAGAVVNSHVSDIKSNQSFPSKFTLTRTYKATDVCGNMSTCAQIINVNDTIAPTIACPTDMTLLLDSMECNRVLCYNVEANDNCFDTTAVFPGLSYLGSYNGNTYYISNAGLPNHKIWTDANLTAAQFGGHLVTIDNANENNFLRTKIQTIIGLLDNQYWIGLRYFPSLNGFKWTTGEPFNYANWGLGQPGVIPGDFVWFWDPTGKWFDSPSLLSRRYIVEFEGGLQNKLIAGIPSGNPFPPGVTTNVYEVTDGGGNKATCSFEINILGSTSISCKNINLALDSSCQTYITAKSLLTNDFNCYDIFVVDLSFHGKPIPNPITAEWLGETIIATVTDPTTGNSCWSYVKIEDKLAPEILCLNDTVSCRVFNNMERPAVATDCSQYEVTLLDEFVEPIYCDPRFIKRVTRKYVSTDLLGNVSDTCSQLLIVERPNLDSIIFPPEKVELFCGRIDRLDAEGHPHPYVTGLPTLEGDSIWPNVNVICNLVADYSDIDLGEINCVRKIMRTWRVREWWCSGEITRTSLQIFEIKDIDGPVVSFLGNDFHATTTNKSCYAQVVLPPIYAEDACHGIRTIDVVYPGGILKNKNGGSVELPVGLDTIVYRLYDSCYNLTTDTLIVTVRDATEPVAICQRRTVVSLNGAGVNWIPAAVFDDGSFDECHVDHFEVRRMDNLSCDTSASVWGPEVGLCCDDVGKEIMIGFKVIDQSGNEGICMVLVAVQDKDKPRITCPPDIAIDCRFDIDFSQLDYTFGKVVLSQVDRDTIIIDPIYEHDFYGYPLDGIALDNCPPTILEETDTSHLDQCGKGFIYRKFIAIDQFGNQDSCTQGIHIINYKPLNDLSIVWPLDLDTTGICDPSVLIPEHLPAIYGLPTFKDDECSQVGISYDDLKFSPTIPGDPCFKIFRVWKIIDWCERDFKNNIIIYTDTQIIKVINSVDPRIVDVCPDTVICNYGADCSPFEIDLRIKAVDDCTDPDDMIYRYKIDFNSDGTIDYSFRDIGKIRTRNLWPKGKHIIYWEVEDLCGNVAKCHNQVEIRFCKAPTAYCIKGLAIGLVPVDVNGNGIYEPYPIDNEEAMIRASDINVASSGACGAAIKFSFTSDTNDVSRTFGCGDIGRVDLDLYVTDENGNQSVCKTYIIVQDSNKVDICPNTLTNVVVEGLITSEKNKQVEYASVNLAQSNMNATLTNFEGQYKFEQVPTRNDYVIKPEKNDDWLNGVTTADIVKIQKHILGQEKIISPYKLIAADVNKSGSITAKDISDIRKLILGVTADIPGNTSWRFVDQSYSFNDPLNAMNETFPESYIIKPLMSDMKVNFIGIKIGDINESAKTRGLNQNVVIRSQHPLELGLENQKLEAGQIYDAIITLKNCSEFLGFQSTFDFNPKAIQILDVIGFESTGFTDANANLSKMAQGLMSVCWNGKLDDYTPLFRIRFLAKDYGQLAQYLKLSSAVTPSLAINISDDQEEQVSLIYNQWTKSPDFNVMQNEPNPMVNESTIDVFIPSQGEAKLSIYDATGKVYYQEAKLMQKGINRFTVSRNVLSVSGVYYYQVDYANQTITKKMVVQN